MGISLMRILFSSNENENENSKENEEQKEEKKLVSPIRVISNKYPLNEKNPIILSRNLYYIKKDEKILNRKHSRENAENNNKNFNKEKNINKIVKKEDDDKIILNKENDILMKWDKMINNKIEENIKENENNLLINKEDINKCISDLKSENEKKYESISKKYDEVLSENNILYTKMKSLLNEDDIQNEETKEDSYSMECLLKNFNVKGYQGTDQLSIKLFIRNNGKKDWPKDCVYLLCQKEKSDIFAEDMELTALKCKMISSINIEFKFLNLVLPGKYNCYLMLNVNGKNYGNEIKIEVEILKKENKEEKKDKI
jgi:hypothetical protein